MDIKILEKLRQELPATAAARYRLPLDQSAGEQLLAAHYLAEMRGRGVDTELDEPTLEMIAKAVHWLREGRKPGLYLYGPVGCGKTTMGNAVCKMIGRLHDSSWKSKRKFVRKTTAIDLVNMKLNEDEMFGFCKTTGMLFIDELGTESVHVKSWGIDHSPTKEVLYHRYDHSLFTIVTSNLNLKKINEDYGERMEDRFYEMFDRMEYKHPSYKK